MGRLAGIWVGPSLDEAQRGMEHVIWCDNANIGWPHRRNDTYCSACLRVAIDSVAGGVYHRTYVR